MKIKQGKQYIFVKSGNILETIEKCKDKEYKGMWVVKRVDSGKEMLVNESALTDVNDPSFMCD